MPKKLTQEKVEQIFLDSGAVLLDNYICTRKKVTYLCSCGKIFHKIRLDNFQQGKRCHECGIKKNSGENNHRWIIDRKRKRKAEELQRLSKKYTRAYRKKYNISKEYDIDHIFPVKAFVDYEIYDLEFINLEENLQPLLKIDNMKKNGKYIKEDFERFLLKHNIIKG